MIEARETEFSLPVFLYFARYFYLEEIDQRWIDHLKTMEALREGIGLRGYGQKDPKKEYKKEGFAIFGEMMGIIGRNVCEKLFHMQLRREETAVAEVPQQQRKRAPRRTIESGGGATAAAQASAGGAGGDGAAGRAAKRARCAATSPRSAATIRVRAAAARSTRSATERWWLREPGRSARGIVDRARRPCWCRADTLACQTDSQSSTVRLSRSRSPSRARR